MLSKARFFKVEKFHTMLASTYLDRLQSSESEKDNLREKFRSFIVKSTFVRAQFLLSRIEKTDMEQEKAILYGKVIGFFGFYFFGYTELIVLRWETTTKRSGLW